MKPPKETKWYQDQIHKDSKEIDQHKNHIIKEIKKAGMKGIFEKPLKRKKTLWTKIKRIFKY